MKSTFFRFVAEIRPSSSYYKLPKGDITNFTELIDSGNIFDPKTGRLTIKDEQQNGIYVFQISALKSAPYGKSRRGLIVIYKNQDLSQQIYESDGENASMMNSLFTFHLKKGDEVKLRNAYDESIEINPSAPFTFTGYKI